nr:probable leucine-rich repeat receptor-like protein kinase At5g49770 [Tanacetum cinerariifolium]
ALRDVWKDTPLKWDDGSDPCSGGWVGITCTNSRVTSISLSSMGFLPVSDGTTPGLDMLINTKHFHFGDNQLDGDIPFRLFNSKMTLIHLLFENNRLTGPIPSTLGLVTSLEVVRLDRNLLTGDVPSNLNNLTKVMELHLSINQLTGPVPNLTGMNSLNYVKMRYTNLAGELPAALFSIPHLQNIDLSNNRIDGSLNISSNPSPQLELVW